MVKVILMMVFVLMSSLSMASEKDPYYTITEVTVTPVDSSGIDYSAVLEEEQKAMPDAATIIMVIDNIIAIGKKIWPIIEAGKPVVKSNMVKAITVIPSDNKDPKVTLTGMANWSVPEAQRFTVIFKNKLGMEVVNFDFTVYFQHSGTYNGKGKYLTSVTTEASRVWAAWGFDLDVNSELISIANVGTQKNPVASAILRIGLKVDGVINEVQTSYSLYLDGRGNVKPLY